MACNYYFLKDVKKVAKIDEKGKCFVWWKDGWDEEPDSVVLDRLYGYDPSEPVGSPYRFGGHIEARAISEEEAKELLGKVE